MNFKTIFSIALVSLPASSLHAAHASTHTVRQATEADMGQPAKADIAVTVGGMVCSFCAQGITKKLKELPQVEAVDVRMAESRVYITLRRGEELPDKKIVDVLEYSGYTAEKIDRTPR